MGGTSGSTSSNDTRNIDESINLNNGGFVAQDGSSVSVLDGGAIGDAFRFGEGVTVEAFGFGSDVIDSYENMAEGSMAFAESTVRSIATSNAMTVSAVKGLAENIKAGETSDGFKVDRAVIYGVVIIAVMLLLVVYLKGKK